MTYHTNNGGGIDGNHCLNSSRRFCNSGNEHRVAERMTTTNNQIVISIPLVIIAIPYI